jgi:holin-like protein
MIAGLVEILLFQGLGEIASRFALPLIPGPVIGLVLLLAWFRLRRRVAPEVELVANALVQHLGLLFVPAAVGVVMFWPQLRSHAVAVVAALVGSVVLTVAVTALVLKLADRRPREGGGPVLDSRLRGNDGPGRGSDTE